MKSLAWIFARCLAVCLAATTVAWGGAVHERMVEQTFESKKAYADPFNDVELDVVFERDGQSWRVPAFWRGGNKWTARFAPPVAGEYTYRLECTDKDNPDLNGNVGQVVISAYSGDNSLLRHGALRVSANKRYFEHADGTPFFWLGDTWWTGLSDRLPWEGFQRLTADRKAKGFTAVQIVAGLVPFEEKAPSDPGFCNEGGAVWSGDFKQINPRYFDFADRRIQHLVDAGLVPVIVGGWRRVLEQMGVRKMKQHWRYIIARYGAYPVLWASGGEAIDPPEKLADRVPAIFRADIVPGGWTEVTRYIHQIDPYGHPVSCHESVTPLDLPVQDESLLDFDLLQSGHMEWHSLADSVAQLGLHYSRTSTTKPVVQSEIGYELLGNAHFQDFQRMAFWLSMLNGAAGHTYGALGTWESYSGDKPLHRMRLSFMSWEEGMNLPGSYQVGLGAKLLRQYRWWRFEPHPEWLASSGVTLFEPQDAINGFKPADEWKKRGGGDSKESFGTYAAGIPGEVRFIYMPQARYFQPATVVGLEEGVRYHAYFWEPSLGIKVDLGSVARPPPGRVIRRDSFASESGNWQDRGSAAVRHRDGLLEAPVDALALLTDFRQSEVAAGVGVRASEHAALILRYENDDHYVAAVYSPAEGAIYLLDRANGVDGHPLGKTPVPGLVGRIRLSAEVRGGVGAMSISDGKRTWTTPIIPLRNTVAGGVGLRNPGKTGTQYFGDFELRESAVQMKEEFLERNLSDAQGVNRGRLEGAEGLNLQITTIPSWDSFGRDKHLLLDAFRPGRLPAFMGDWILILENSELSRGTE